MTQQEKRANKTTFASFRVIRGQAFECIAILAILLITATAAFAQTGSDGADRSRAFGFCYAQQSILAKIRTDQPRLRAETDAAEASFGVVFGKSCKAISDSIPEKSRQELYSVAAGMMPKVQMSEKASRDFIERVRARSKGEIESPIKETLLSYNPDFLQTPELEFTSGYTNRYSTLGLEKAGGLRLELSYPASWKREESNGATVMQMFLAKNGYENPSGLLLIDDYLQKDDKPYSTAQIGGIFAPATLKNLAPSGATVVETAPATLGGQTGAMIVYEQTAKNPNGTFTVRIISYITIYKGKFVALNFSSGGPSADRAPWTANFEKNRKLFTLIANSLVLLIKRIADYARSDIRQVYRSAAASPLRLSARYQGRGWVRRVSN